MKNQSATAILADLEHEEAITLAKAVSLPSLCIGGKARNPSTIWRWVTSGCRGVVLESVRIGGMTCTTPSAVSRFLIALNTPAELRQPAVSAKARSKAIEQANRELDEAGIR